MFENGECGVVRQGLAFAFYRPRFPYLPGRFALLPLAFDSALATSIMRLFFKKTTSMRLISKESRGSDPAQ